MKRRLTDIVRCPSCLARLTLHVLLEDIGTAGEPGGSDVDEGFLACTACRLLYPVIAGVPRLTRNAAEEHRAFYQDNRSFIGELAGQNNLPAEAGSHVGQRIGGLPGSVYHARSNKSFSLQWQMYQYDDHTWFKDDADLRRREFLYGMDLEEKDLNGRLILDAGCGNGRLTSSIARYGAEVVGIDLSSSIERAHQNRRRFAGGQAPFVHFVQANVMEPPFAPETFDHIHTTGVLHHTPDTEKAFLSFLRLGRPGGRVYVQLYRRREAWVRIINQCLRAVTTRLPVRLLYALCYLMAPVHTAIIRVVAWCRGETTPLPGFSRRERAISMFDHFSPRYQYRYTPAQVRAMFERAGVTDVKDVTLDNEARHMVAFVGNKASHLRQGSGGQAEVCVASAAS